MATATSFPVPDLSDARVLRAVAGIRPCREGGLRLERESLGNKTLVHNYGHGGCGITLGFGCAKAAADLVDGADGPVAVLGAGVIGLTTAFELLRRGTRVRVYAESFAAGTTSIIAGAQWLPTGIDFPPAGSDDRERFNRLLRDSGEAFRSIGRARWGVESLPVFEPRSAELHAEFFESGVLDAPEDFDSEPAPGGIVEGRRYRTDFIHTPRFMRTLHAEVERLGGAFVSRAFAGASDVESLDEHAVVNCLALGSERVFGDDSMYPARGVLVHLEPQPLGYIVHDEYKYLFPREDALILGGTFEPGETETEPPSAIVNDILDHHRRFFGRS